MKLQKKFKKLLNKLLIFTLFLGSYKQTKSMAIASNPEVIAKVLTAASSALTTYIAWKNSKNSNIPSIAQDFLNEAQYSNAPKNQIEIDQDTQLKLQNLPYSSQSLLKNTAFGHQTIIKFFKEKYGIDLTQALSKDSKLQSNSQVIPEVRSNSTTIRNETELARENARVERLNKTISIFVPEKLQSNGNFKFDFNFNQNSQSESQVNIKVEPTVALATYGYISSIFKTSRIKEVQRNYLESTLTNNPELKEKHNQALNQIIQFASKTFNFNNSINYKSLESRYKNLLILNNLNKTNSDDLSILGCKSEALNKLVRLLNKIYFDENGNRLHPYQIQKREHKAKDLILYFIESVASNKDHHKELLQLASKINPAFMLESQNAANKKFAINYDNGTIKTFLRSCFSKDYLIGGISSESVLNNKDNQTILKIINYCALQALSQEDTAFFDKAKELLKNLDKNSNTVDIGTNIISYYEKDLQELKKEAQSASQDQELRKYISMPINDRFEPILTIDTDAVCNNQTIALEEEQSFLNRLNTIALNKDQSKIEAESLTDTKEKEKKCKNCGSRDVNPLKDHQVFFKQYKLNSIEKKYLENIFKFLNIKIDGQNISFKDIDHIFKPTIKCVLEKGIRQYKVTGLHHDLNGELYKNKSDINLHIAQGPIYPSGCKIINVKYKNSETENKTCFPDSASREKL